jgi:hypothetical protein
LRQIKILCDPAAQRNTAIVGRENAGNVLAVNGRDDVGVGQLGSAEIDGNPTRTMPGSG